MGCFTTSRHYYEGVVLLQHHDITFLLRMVCLLLHVLLHHVTLLQRMVVLLVHNVFTTNCLFVSTCFTTVALHFYHNYYFARCCWLLLLLGNSAKFRKPLGIKKGVRLYFVFPRIHRSWLVNLFWKSYWRGLRRLVASYVSRCIPVNASN